VITTHVAIPFNLEAGESTLEVVANGIPSEAARVHVEPGRDGRGK
jgi:hypothetical protein